MQYIINYISCLTAFLLLLQNEVMAQQLPSFNQHIYNSFLFNPGRAGADSTGNLTFGQRKQWANMPDAPDSYYISVESPIRNQRIGLGGLLVADKSHIVQRINGNIAFSYELIGKEQDWHIRAGLSTGFLTQSILYKDVIGSANDKILFDKDKTATTINFAAGALIKYKNLSLDLAAPQMIDNNISYADPTKPSTNYTLKPHFFAKTSYDWSIPIENNKTTFGIEPSVALRFTSAAALPAQWDFNTLFNYNKRIWLGAGARVAQNMGKESETNNAAFLATIGCRVAKCFSFYYTYEGAKPNLVSSLGNTHEITIAYRFGQDKVALTNIENNFTDLKAKVNNNHTVVRDSVTDINKRLASTNIRLDKRIDTTNTKVNTQNTALQGRVEKSEYDIENIKTVIKYNDRKLKFERLGSVFFYEYKDRATDNLTGEAKSNLLNIKQILDNKKTIKIYVQGQAKRGESVARAQIFESRVTAVKQYLVSIGVAESLIIASPYAEQNPLKDTPSTNPVPDRTSDMRVDIILLEDTFK
jgi:type IX secretion system PorP/SprF family membrane protein